MNGIVWNVVHARAQKLVRQADGAGEPITHEWISSKADVPIKLRSGSLDAQRDIAKPEGPEAPMPQKVDADEGKVVLRTEYPHGCLLEWEELRAAIEIVERSISQLGVVPILEIKGSLLGLPALHSREDRLLPLWRHDEVNVAGGTQPQLGVETRDCPALDQYRLDSRRSEPGEDPCGQPFLQRVVHDLFALNLMEPLGTRVSAHG
jgi:hypothetical protein